MKKISFFIIICIVLIGIGVFTMVYGNDRVYSRNIIKLIDNNQIEELTNYLNNKNNVNEKPFVFDLDRTNYSPLTYAAFIGNVEAVEVLLEHGADVNNINATNDTSPLIASLQKAYKFNPNRIIIANLLIASGADINYRDRGGNGDNAVTAAIIPLTSNDPETEKIEQYDFVVGLIDKGANFEINCDYGNILAKAAAYNNELLTNYLVNIVGIDINIVDLNNYSPLMYAVKYEALDTVRNLVFLGATLTVTSNEGKTAIDIAYENNNSEIIDILNGEA